MTDKTLIRSCEEVRQREREVVADMLRHLREIDRRRLYSELNYKSLFDFCVRHLGYSEDQAYRRINSVKLIQQMPEAEEKIEQGSLSLSNASLLQKMTVQCEKPLSRDEKLELMNKVENKSRREAERILGDAKTTLHIQVSDETDEKFQKLRGLTAHKYKNLPELFEAMVDLALDEKHGLLPAKASLAKKHRIMDQANAKKAETPREAQASASNSPEFEERSVAKPAAMTAEDPAVRKVSVQARAQDRARNLSTLKCTRCGSNHAPQTEHIIPRGKGGTDDPNNLTLLCRNCNQRAAIREFGIKKMERYLQRSDAKLSN